jgi:hypothetical protein
MDGISSTKPYLIRALHEWCSDNGVTPYIVVSVDQTVDVPKESVRDGEIVLNVSLDATNGLLLGNDYISFRARFGGIPREIVVSRVQVCHFPLSASLLLLFPRLQWPSCQASLKRQCHSLGLRGARGQWTLANLYSPLSVTIRLLQIT